MDLDTGLSISHHTEKAKRGGDTTASSPSSSSAFQSTWPSTHTFKGMLVIAGPVAMSVLCADYMTVIMYYYIGHTFPRSEFAAVAAGLSFTNLTAYSISAGLASALDTLGSQEYGRMTKEEEEQAIEKHHVEEKQQEEEGDNDTNEKCDNSISSTDMYATATDETKDKRIQSSSELSNHHQYLSRNTGELGKLLMMGVICNYTFHAPFAVGYFYSYPLLAKWMEEPLARAVAEWLRWSLLMTTPVMTCSCLHKFAEVQCEAWVGTCGSLSLLVLVPAFLFGFHITDTGSDFGMGGPAGVAIAMGLANWINLFLTAVIIFNHKKLRTNFLGTETKFCWRKRFRDVFRLPRWKRYLSLALPSLAAHAGDSWAYEAFTIIAAHLGTLSLSIWSIMMQVYCMLFGGIIGLAVASAVKLGNSLGEGKPQLAQAYYRTICILIVIYVVCVGSLLFFHFEDIFGFLTSDQEVISEGHKIALLAVIGFAVDAAYYVAQGVFRGIGRQTLGAVIVCVSLWCIGVPGAYYFAEYYANKSLPPSSSSSILTTIAPLHPDSNQRIRHTEHSHGMAHETGDGVYGILLGLVLGISVAAPAYFLYIAFFVDWDSLSREIKEQGEAEDAAEAAMIANELNDDAKEEEGLLLVVANETRRMGDADGQKKNVCTYGTVQN